MMWSTQIENVLSNVPNFLGVFACDNLPKISKYPFSLIANTDKKVESGTHWIAIYVDENGKGLYFDSYGRKPFKRQFETFFNRYCFNGYDWNQDRLQCLTCVTCGEYSCCYVILREMGKSHEDFIRLFAQDYLSNDILVKQIFNVLT